LTKYAIDCTTGSERQISTTFGEVKVYKFEGESKTNLAPLLLLPGKSASTPMWEAYLDDLIKDRPVYTRIG